GQTDAADDQRAAAVAEEWQGQALGRQQADVHANIDQHLADPLDGNPVGHIGGKQLFGLFRPQSDVQGTHGDEHEQADGDQRTDHAQLLGQHGEDEVGVRLGQVKLLLDTVAQADAEPLTTAEGDQRLTQLIAGAILGGPGIYEVGQAFQAIGLTGHYQHADRQHTGDQRDEAQQIDAAEEQHGNARADQHHGSAEIRLGQQQKGHRAEHQHRLEETGKLLAHLILTAHQITGDEHYGEQLGQFRGLQVEQTKADPAFGTVYLTADARNKHHDQQGKGDQQQAGAVALPEGHGNQEGDQRSADAQSQVNQVADHVVQRAARQRRGDFRTGRGDHHQAEAEQGQATHQ